MGMDQRLLKPSSGSTVPLPAYYFQHEFNNTANAPLLYRNDSGFVYFRTPQLITLKSGVILFVACAMTTQATDWSGVTAVCRRSLDNGRTWSPLIQIVSPSGLHISGQLIAPGTGYDSAPQINNVCPVEDPVTGTIWVLYDTHSSLLPPPSSVNPFPRAYATYSTDSGLTWAASGPGNTGSDITARVFPGTSNTPPLSGNWAWALFGPSPGIYKEYAPNKNRMIIMGDFRVDPNRSGTQPSYIHCVVNDDHTLPPNPQSWVSGGRQTINATNEDSNETCVVECKTGVRKGELYANCRRVGSYNYRGYTRSADGGQTWDDTTTDTLWVQSTQGSMCSAQGGRYIVLAHPTQSGYRREMGLRLSTDNGATFSTPKKVNLAWAAYSSICETPDGYLLLAYERGWNGDLDTQNGPTWAHHIGLTRLSPRWLTDTTHPQYVQYHFNEYPSGTVAQTGAEYLVVGNFHESIRGVNIIDYGPYDLKICGHSTTNTGVPIYTDGMRGDSALSLTANSGVGVVLAESGNSFYQAGTGSFTFEIGFRPLVGATGYVLHTNSSQSSRYWQLTINQNGKPIGRLRDGGSINISRTGTTTINDGNYYFVTLRRDRVASPNTFEMKIHSSGGTELESMSITDPTTTLSSLSAIPPVIHLGMYYTHTLKCPLDVDILRMTKGVVSDANLLANNYPKTPRATIPTYSTDITGSPSLWLQGFRKNTAFYDKYKSTKLPDVPVSGTPADAIVEISDNRRTFRTNFSYQGPYLDYDPIVGWAWAIKPDQASFPFGWFGSGTKNDYNYIQNSGIFTISLFTKLSVVPPTGGAFVGSAVLLDNRNSTSTNAGFTVTRDWATKTIGFGMSGSGVSSYFQSSTTTLPSGAWYHLAVVGNGTGQPVHVWINPATGNSSTITRTDSLSNITNLPTGHIPIYDLCIGGRAGAAAGFIHGSIVDATIFPRALPTGEIRNLFAATTGWATRLG